MTSSSTAVLLFLLVPPRGTDASVDEDEGLIGSPLICRSRAKSTKHGRSMRVKILGPGAAGRMEQRKIN